MSTNGQPSEHKTFPSTVLGIDEAEGIVETVFAVFGNIDSGLDILHPGSFRKSLAERGLKVRVLDHHNTDSIMNVIGRPVELRELERNELPVEMLEQYPDATGGAYAKIQMLMNTPEGQGAFLRLQGKAVDEWSFGYTPLDVDYSKAMVDNKEVTVRNLRTCRLFEVSPVIWGMNPATTTLGAKGDNATEPPADTDEQDAPLEADAIQERKSALTDALRVALAEAEALELLEAPLAPAEDAGRDDDADDQGAGPEDPPPTSEDTERLRAELLESLASLED